MPDDVRITGRAVNRTITVLMLSLFTVGSAEFVIAGLLPSIATDLDVTIYAAGMLVSAYAIAIVLAGPAITLLTARFSRRPLMLGLMILFVAGNALGAIAPTYEILLISRIASALTHCTFFALALVIGAGAVPAHKQGAAIARLAIGLNMANVLGVPLGTLLAASWGWRSTLWAVAALGALALVLVRVVIPAPEGIQRTGKDSVVGELRVLRRRPVLMAIAMSALSCGGVFAAYTFIAPILENLSGYPAQATGGLLLLFGLGAFTGSIIGGRLTDRTLLPSLTGVLAAVPVVLALYALLATNRWPSAVGLFVFGLSFGAILPALQARVMRSAGSDAPTLALAVNIAAMNIGIAFGSWLGGTILDQGHGLQFVILAGAVIAAAGFLLALAELLKERRIKEMTG
ncbi:MFS transporter [Actinoalloteichus hymeniacidonis]|uniref:Arabinose efflux permease family protein n=1 Tax=Actinoalloteichus hymeniacidonis TaxID=340345 RepID=A0AAC9HNA8_9PSEU|nr:MFS transporter [Actinoalloteichus hymeniacidonis]AOS61866.1 arabinose efflux permease family protein [Actinoalloteichus hymeniacidonis]MBB5910115.1 DHA1 family inner membrane transport protein [Actinoalloteichus hymeniacidonis]